MYAACIFAPRRAPHLTGRPFEGRIRCAWIAVVQRLIAVRQGRANCKCAHPVDDSPLGEARLPESVGPTVETRGIAESVLSASVVATELDAVVVDGLARVRVTRVPDFVAFVSEPGVSIV